LHVPVFSWQAENENPSVPLFNEIFMQTKDSSNI
jgi:hypothetical protein